MHLTVLTWQHNNYRKRQWYQWLSSIQILKLSTLLQGHWLPRNDVGQPVQPPPLSHRQQAKLLSSRLLSD